MTTFLLTLLIFTLLVVGMAIGVLMGRKPIKGTCGGMSALGMGASCDICGGDPARCDEEKAAPAANTPHPESELSYDATQTK